MEEVFLLVIGGDEAKAAIGDDTLDGSGGHEDLQLSANGREQSPGPFAEWETKRSIATRGGSAPTIPRLARNPGEIFVRGMDKVAAER